MNGENEYERLKKLGYTEEQIEVVLGPISKLELNDSPMGPGRQDKSVNVTDSNGNTMRTGNIMLGHNKEGIPLTNGEYVSLEELKEAVSQYVSEHQEKRKIVCKKTGKSVDVSTMSDAIAKALAEEAQIHLQGPSMKVTNQDTMSYALGKDRKKGGLFMLGNHGFKLSTGEYVTVEEFRKAMESYVYMKKEKEETVVPPLVLPPEKTHRGPENVVIFGEDPKEVPKIILPGEEDKKPGPRVIYLPGGKEHIVPEETSIIPVNPGETVIKPVGPDNTGVAVVPADTHIPAVTPEPVVRVPAPVPPQPQPNPEPKVPTKEPETVKKNTTKKVKKKRWFNFIPLLVSAAIIAAMGIAGHFTKTEKQDVVDYVVHQMEEQVTYKSVDELVEDTMAGLKTGDTIYMGQGQAFFHESDRVSDIHDTFGNPEGLRPTGDYQVEYFSVLHGGKIQNVTYQKGVPLSEMLEQTAQQLGVPKEELTVMGHAVTEDGRIAGWVNVKEAVQKGIEEQQRKVVDEVKLVEGELISGIEHDFNGEVSMTDSEGNQVSISLTDSAGDLLDGGSQVVGDDGLTYQIDSAELSTEDVKTDDPNLLGIAAAGLVGAAGIGATYALNRKKEEQTDSRSELEQMLNNHSQEKGQTQGVQR